jgi:methionyl-tRNA synthetase
MSKSRGNVVRTETILDAFGSLKPELAKAEQDLFGADVLRYFLLREVPFGQDGSFSFDALVQRYNSDLANGYGNLVSRTLAMIKQYFSAGNAEGRPSGDATIPPLEEGQTAIPLNEELRAAVATATAGVSEGQGQYDFSKAVERLWSLVAATDVFITVEAPWKLAKLDSVETNTRLRQVLYTAAESIRIITALAHPVLPYATARVWEQLGLGDIEVAAKNGELKNLQWGGLTPGTKLGALAPIFPRADKGLIQIMADAETMNTTTNTPAAPKATLSDEMVHGTNDGAVASTAPEAGPRTVAEPNPGTHVGASAGAGPALVKTPPHAEAQASGVFAATAAATPDTPQIAIDDFVKIDLRVAQIVVAERIPKADKLLRLEVDLGYERRQILSGIAEWYTPEDLIGRRIVVIANLAPRKMRGLESHGMLLAASHGENGKPVLATFGEEIALGARLK